MLKGFGAVIVTGGSSGIGKSFIKLIGRMNPEIQFCNLSRSQPDMTGVELKLRHFACDLGDSAQIEKATEEVTYYIRPLIGKLKILLINNSGFGSYGFFPEPDLAHQTSMIDVNVRAVVDLTARFLPILKEKGGAVINIASTAAFQPTPYMATYGATKSFLLHWSLALNEELRADGINVLAVCPGPTSTNFFKRAGLTQSVVNDSFGQTSDQVVMNSLCALSCGKAMVVSGLKNKILTFISGKVPKVLATRVSRRVLAHFRLKQKQ